jgi:Ca2+-transporting ATPase
MRSRTVHVTLTEMVIDQICSLAFDGVPEEPRIMRCQPRRTEDALVGCALMWRGLL